MYKDQLTVINVVSQDPLGGEKSTTVTISKTQPGINGGPPMMMGQQFQFQITDPADVAKFAKGATVQVLIDVVPAT